MTPHAEATSGPVVILSGSLGQGHHSVAEACAAALARVDAEVETVDCMSLLGGVGHRLGEAFFRRLIDIAPLYDALHFSQLRAGTGLARRMESSAARRVVDALSDVLPPRGDGLLLSVFATGAGVAGRIAAADRGWRAAVFCTDATAHSMWVHAGVDRYLVCTRSEAGTVRQYDPFASVVEVPPPVRPGFFEAPTREVARREQGLSQDDPCVLLMSGGWGRGPLDAAASALAEAGYQVLAVAGHNVRLLQHLREAAVAVGRSAGGMIEPIGFTDRIPLLMAASDVVVTSAGQTSHEARVVGRPQVLLDVIPGHGRENLLLELEAGNALASAPTPSAVVRAVNAGLDGAFGRSDPWPISSPKEWDERFLSAIADLLKSRT